MQHFPRPRISRLRSADIYLRGGEEVLLDVGGQDATEAFEDVGHSDEARELLEGLLVGKLKRVPGDPEPAKAATDHISAGPKSDSGSSFTLYAAVLGGAILAYLAYVFMAGGGQK